MARLPPLCYDVVLQKETPRRSGEKVVEMGCVQTRSKVRALKERVPLALGHDWLRIFPNRSLANRILANRSLANRRRRRRRLLARQIGSGGSAQHRQGCSHCGENLQHV